MTSRPDRLWPTPDHPGTRPQHIQGRYGPIAFRFFFWLLLMVFECFSYFFMPFRSSHDTSRFFRHVARSASRMSNDEFFHDKSGFPWFPSGSEGEGKKNIQTHMLKKTHVCFKVCWIWAPDVSKCFKFCQVATAQTSWRWPSLWVGRITLRGELL